MFCFVLIFQIWKRHPFYQKAKLNKKQQKTLATSVGQQKMITLVFLKAKHSMAR